MINKTKRLESLQGVSQYGLILRSSIKDFLKKNSLTYTDAARVLGVSLATFKRLMIKSDFTLENAVRISHWMGIPFLSLWTESKGYDMTPVQFSLKQENYLAKNAKSFYALILIMKGHEISDLCRELKTSKIETDKIIFQLDKLNLVKILPNEKFRVVSMGPFKWNKSGPLETAYYQKFCRTLCEKMTSNEQIFSFLKSGDENRHFRPFEFYLKKSSLHEFIEEMNSLVNKFHSRAILESHASNSEELQPVSGVVSMQLLNAWKSVLIDS